MDVRSLVWVGCGLEAVEAVLVDRVFTVLF